jgi:hypothetical protein
MMSDENHKMSARQWSLRRMFFWVLFAALVCSQLSHIYHSTRIGFNDFTISDDQINEWLSELDPTARAYAGSSGGGRSGNDVDRESNYWISADAATAEMALPHLRDSVVAKAGTEGWEITGSGQSGEGFSFSLSKGASRFRTYFWVLSTGKSSFEEHLEEDGKNVFRVMVVQVGYTQP